MLVSQAYTETATDAGSSPNPPMRAARFHGAGQPFTVDLVDRPSARPSDVVVEVKACGVVPNLLAMLDPPPMIIVPPRPTIYGLDAVGVIAETGSQVHGFAVGDRVYVNPWRYCGHCRACRRGTMAACEWSALNGYFGIGASSFEVFEDYPYGGFCEFMTAPATSLVRLPDAVDWETGARWGYLGTGYAALRKAEVDAETVLAVNGASGILGLGTVMFALGMGVARILAIGRDQARLEDVRALAPDRIETFAADGSLSVADWMRSRTEGRGADVVVDALPTFGSVDAFAAAVDGLARGGTHVNIGGVVQPVPLPVVVMMQTNQRFLGSNWMTSAEGHEMAALVASGRVDLSAFEHTVFDLDDINEGLEVLSRGVQHGGFTNFVVRI